MNDITVHGDPLAPGDGPAITFEWSWGLIVTSYLISVLGSYTYFQILSQLTLSKGRVVKQLYLLLSSVSLGGCAVWSMHFIGMMACNIIGAPVSYDLGLTILSGLVAIISCRISLMFLTINFPSWLIKRIGGEEDCPLLINLPTPSLSLPKSSLEDVELNVGLHYGLKNGFTSSPIYFNRNFLVKPYFKEHSSFHLEREPLTPGYTPPDSPPYDSDPKPIFYNQAFLNPYATSSNTTTTSTSASDSINLDLPHLKQGAFQQHNIFNQTSSLLSSSSSSNSSNSPIYSTSSPKSQINGFELENLVDSSSDFNIINANRSNRDFLGSSSNPAYRSKKKKTLWMKFKKYIFRNGFISSNIWFNNRNTFFRLVAGSFLLATGIFGMHYTGMAAMRMNASSHYIGWIVMLSFVIAWLASFAALYITAFSNTHLQHLISSFIMGMGVCGMHYTGMKSVNYKYKDMGYTNEDNNFFLALNISLMSLLVCFFLIVLTSIVNKRVRDKLSKLTAELKMEKLKSDILINSILPTAISNRMKQGEIYVAEECSGMSIIFADIVNFTKMTNNYSPRNLVLMLNRLYSLFDDLSETMHLEKIKTIGDSYMVVCGLPWHNDVDDAFVFSPDHSGSNNEGSFDHKTAYNANKALLFAVNLLDLVEKVNLKYGYDIHLRIGINTGDAIAGVIGKKRFSFDIWGDAVNVASRMESSGYPDKICVSENTYNLLSKKYVFEKQSITVKGKGDMGLYILDRECLKSKSTDIFEPYCADSGITIPTIGSSDINYVDEIHPTSYAPSYIKRVGQNSPNTRSQSNSHNPNQQQQQQQQNQNQSQNQPLFDINNEGGRGNS